jgi:hypothetical protein
MEVQFNAGIPFGVRGEKLPVKFLVNNPSPVTVKIEKVQWLEAVLDLNKTLGQNQLFSKNIDTDITGAISSPYWLLESGTPGMYPTKNKDWIGKANTPNPYVAAVIFSIEGKKFSATLPLQHRSTDPVRGEVVTPFQVLPKASLKLNAPVSLFAHGESRKVKVTVKNLGPSITGTLRLKAPQSWEVTPSSVPVKLQGKGNEVDYYFKVKAPQKSTVGLLKPSLVSDGQSINFSLQEISYDHIPKQYLVSPASAKIVALNLKMGVKKIAYVEGAGDLIPDALTALGVEVETMDAANITLERLNNFDAVVVGIRAFNVKEALAYKNKILWDYVAAGGNLLIQYNTSRRLKTNELSPLDLNLSRDRVSNEKAVVKILHPNHPILNQPNSITEEDFEGWVQERGLYFPNQWDSKFTPLFEMNDEGESPKKGALLVAQYGKGRLVYTGLSFFRQLPAGVPGAFRLFFNLIAKP